MNNLKTTLCALLTILSLRTAFTQEIFEADNICTKKDEYGITFITDDWICFGRKDGKKTLYFSKKVNGKWTAPEVAPFSGEYDDEYPKFNEKTKRLFFASNRSYEGRSSGDTSNDIWFVEWSSTGWGMPVHLSGKFSTPGIDSGGMDSGDDVYFHSDRSGRGLNAVDIYKLNINADGEDPMKLSISSPRVDGEPYLFNNGNAILFMSGGHNSVGASDIFLSVKNDNGWQQPVSVDSKGIVNTSQWEYTPALNPDKSLLFFTRIVDGQADIYFIEVKKLLEVYSLIQGK